MPKVVLRSLFPDRTTYFTGRINIRDKKDWKTITKGVNITQQFEVYFGEVNPARPCWRIRFDQERTSYFIEWKEVNGEPKTDQDKQRKSAAEWLSQHEKVKPLFGKPNTNILGEPTFSLEWEGMRNTSVADANDLKFEVYAKMRKMSAEEKRDCAFFYGINASTLLHSQLINRLGDFENGILMSDVVRDGEKISPREHFLTLYGKESFTDVKLLTKKCLIYNLITSDNKGYWFNQEFIGITLENIYEYMNANSGVTDLLKREVAKKENPVEDDMAAEVKKNSAKESGFTPKAPVDKVEPTPEELRQQDIANEELTNLKEKAKGLGIKGTQFMKKETLMERIAEKEAVPAS